LKCGIVELAYPPCTKGASMVEDVPALKSCHSIRKCSQIRLVREKLWK
jgi:hypothetical protein